MEPRRPPEYALEIYADRACVRNIVKATLHTIFFHRYFTPLHPSTQDVLDLTLPYVKEADIEALVDQKTTALVRQLDLPATQASPQYQPKTRTSDSARGQIVVQFLERKRRKSGWFGVKGDEESVWEYWILDVTLGSARGEQEAAQLRRKMERSLHKTAMHIVSVVNRERAHIPPITTNESNPFPYQILVNPKEGGWGQKIGLV